MAIPLRRQIDAENRKPLINVAPATAAGEVVEYSQMLSLMESNAWKDNARVATQANITLASPGASVDGISMSSGDRVLVRAQSTQAENGIYIWNGAASLMTRALDASTFDELESAVIMVDEGTSAGVRYRQTQVNGVIGTNNVIWSADGVAPSATETVSGVAEIATQAETDTGADDARIVTPLKLKNSPHARKSYITPTAIGDGTATSIAVTHNLGFDYPDVAVFEATGSKRRVLCEVQNTNTNTVTLLFDAAPALNSLHVRVVA